ncbi:DNA-binding SARP family transcriptional activator/Tfp pilus assembly protein PilF [Saccharothrix tamanrassetensis]|uniref:DNA-binding SARP family transcriptional activator/Tfp pilus assembly protein PilF n=1 Tax=Saccharothrix tamanrassetensis TaxID=1051531 RepID=A0A841CDD5_9PSEU|nr:BTAD domain-containing putative transcriptional regulator [Saccharothrix tamanrassetensis]MBB5954374.1 DNA-binding SARP family transcriptional activator/Tfp pilus assembly protein PilF [Saccharothrix tamanrassetensis]
MVAVLGEVEVRQDDRVLPVGHARQRAVLAALAVETNRVVPVESLIDRVWGEQPPTKARLALRTYLSHLRRALAQTGITITRQGSGYLLALDPDSVDVHRLHRLLAAARKQEDPSLALALVEDALGLWRGEALPELDTPWAHELQERLRQERAAAEADWIDLALRCGRHSDLLPELRARAVADPLDERVAAQLMLALYRNGRQADALEHYQRVRQRLVEELGTDPGPALRELHQRILTAELSLAGGALATENATGPSAVPRQLPAAPAQFVGRHDELGRLDAILQDASDTAATVVVSVIVGAGGIGKTWLALHWAHRHADRFPDGQMFVDLRGFSPDSEPMDPAVAVRGFLDALDVAPGRIPVDPHAQAALFRSLMTGRRMLLVLDNAANTAQVTPLLPGNGSCTVVVTSRNRLPGLITGQGARHLALHILDDTEARDLLTTRLGAARVEAEPAAVGDLKRLCGGFPLALSIVASRAHTDPYLSLAAIAAELRESGLDALDDGDPAASLPTVLSWSHRALTTDQATAFALLGTAPGPDIGLPAAASLVGLPLNDARTLLRRLEQASLISQDAHGRHRMHDLIRTYAATTAHDLADDVREAALCRVLGFYTHTARTADHLLDSHRQALPLDPPVSGTQIHPLPDSPAAMAWFDTEHTNLLAVQHIAATRTWHHTVWQVAWSLASFQARRGQLHDRLVVWCHALKAAAHLSDPTTRVLAHRFVGVAYADLGRHQEAVGHLHHALALAERYRDSVDQAHTHQTLAWVWGQREDNRRALYHATRALDLFRAVDRPTWEARALNDVGWFAAHGGDYVTARVHCEEALALHRCYDDPDGKATILDSLGYIDHHDGHYDQAIRHYQQALDLFRDLGDTYSVADTLDNLGHSHAALGRHDQAHVMWREALELYREQGRKADAERVQRQLDALDSGGHPSTESST